MYTINTQHVSLFFLSECQDAVTQMYNSSGNPLTVLLYSQFTHVCHFSLHSVIEQNTGYPLWPTAGVIPGSSSQEQTNDRRPDKRKEPIIEGFSGTRK